MDLTANQTASGIGALLERGFFFLEQSQFKVATLYFNRILDLEPKNSAAYWGLLIAELQCTSAADMYQNLGIPIEDFTNFKCAVDYASDEERAYFLGVEKMAGLTAFRKAVDNSIKGDSYLCEQWIAHTRKFAEMGSTFSAELRYIKKQSLGKPDIGNSACLLRAYDKLNGMADQIYDKQFHAQLLDCFAGWYRDSQLALQKVIISHPTGTNVREQIDSLVNPLSSKARPDLLALDGNPADIAERYIKIADTLRSKCSQTTELIKVVDYCYISAGDGFDSDRRSFHRDVCFDSHSTQSHIDCIIGIDPNVGIYYWRYILAYTDNLQLAVDTRSNDADTDKLVKKAADDYTEQEAADKLADLTGDLQAADAEYSRIIQRLSNYYKRTEELCSDEQLAEIKPIWDGYTAKLQESRDKAAANINRRIFQLESKVAADNASGRSRAAVYGAALSVGAVIVVLLMLPVFIFLMRVNKTPQMLLEHSAFWTYMAVIGAALVIGIIQFFIAISLAHSKPKKYKLPVWSKIATTLGVVAPIVLTPLAIGLLISSLVGLPKTMGVINITKPEDMQYIKNVPMCDFELKGDLDLSGIQLKQIGSFTGTLNGCGHTIRGLSLPENGYIQYQKGDISDLNFTDLACESDWMLFEQNKGNLKNITVHGIKLDTSADFFGIANENKGTMELCTVNNITGECQNFYGIVERNDENSNLLGCKVTGVKLTCGKENGFGYAYGLMSVNSGKVSGCSVSAELKAYNVAGLVGSTGGEHSIVECCSVSGKLTGESNLAGFARTVRGGGQIRNCYSVAKLTLAVRDNYPVVGGFICSHNDKSGQTFTVRNCYFGGSITVTENPDHPTDQYNLPFKYSLIGGLFADDMCGGGGAESRAYVRFDCCFITSSYKVDGVEKDYVFRKDDERFSIGVNNTYITNEDYDLLAKVVDGSAEKSSKNKILKSKFITDTLEWDSEVWDIKDGKYPTLKPYVSDSQQTDKEAK